MNLCGHIKPKLFCFCKQHDYSLQSMRNYFHAVKGLKHLVETGDTGDISFDFIYVL